MYVWKIDEGLLNNNARDENEYYRYWLTITLFALNVYRISRSLISPFVAAQANRERVAP